MEPAANDILAQASRAYARGELGLAFSLYEKLASAGHTESQVFVGWMLADGKGVPLDTKQAMYWFERAASLGSAHGIFYLARQLTAIGEHEKALFWYRRAAALDYLPAIFWVGYSLSRGKGTRPNIEQAYRHLETAGARGHVYAQREIAMLDLRGHRGVLRRLLGLVGFIAAIFKGVALSARDDQSEKLRA